LRIEQMRPGLEDAFLRLHDERNDAGWCRCVAWWVPTWEGWGERTAAKNLEFRCDLFDRGEHDGLLAFEGKEPVGWVQVGPRDRLVKLVSELGLDPDPAVWAATCFLVAPTHRGRGVAGVLLRGAVECARAAGASRIEGYPRSGETLADADAWTGTVALFQACGLTLVREGSPRSVYALALAGPR
jgi:GNAT superfamily N-acetyltransferase